MRDGRSADYSMESLWKTYFSWGSWHRYECGCWRNDAGFTLTYCGRDSPKIGTHHK